MTQFVGKFDYMDFDDFEELLPDCPHDEKWELIDGRVVKLMVGARWEHHFIVQNLSFSLTTSLRAKGGECRVFAESFRVKKETLKSSVLPDLVVRCGTLERGAASLDDPIILGEVVSDGSRARDKVEKLRIYKKFASVRHYLMVERDMARIEVVDRSGEIGFTTRLIEGLDAVLDLPALDLSIPLAEIYRDVLTS